MKRRCRAPAVAGKRGCRMHGGAPGSGGQPGNHNARKHGFYGAAAEAERSRLRTMLKMFEKTLKEMG